MMKSNGYLKVSKPKVIHVTWSIPHYRAAIFRRLSQNPNMNFVICADNSSEGWKGEKIATAAVADESKQINWHKIKLTRIKFPLFRSYEWQPEAITYVIKHKPDVVIVHGITKALSNWILVPLCKVMRIPIIDWTQGVRGPEKPLKWMLRRLLAKSFDAHMFYGEWAKNWYASHSFKMEQLFVIRNSLDYDKQLQIRESISQSDIENVRQKFGVNGTDSRLIFHSGRLESQKKLPLLFSAIKVLKNKGYKIKLVLIGKGRDENKLKDDVKKENIQEDVVFYGACYKEDVLGRIITASDLTVVPGAIGLVAMHSLVYGTPVITCYNTTYKHGPEVEAIIEGKTGGYFKNGDVDDLTEKMEKMLYPVPCKNQMSEACKKIIDKYYTPEYQERVIINALNFVLPPEKHIPVPD